MASANDARLSCPIAIKGTNYPAMESTNYNVALDVAGPRTIPATGLWSNDDETGLEVTLVTKSRNAEGVLPRPDLGTTKAGYKRQRIAWTNEMNLYLMQCYYRVTNKETDMTYYRRKLLNEFKKRYPELPLTEQAVADRKRYITKSKTFSDEILQNIIENIQDETQQPEIKEITENTIVDTQPTELPTSEIITINTQDTRNHIEQINCNALREKIEDTYNEMLTKYLGIDPKSRPSIPQLFFGKLTDNLITITNEILAKHVTPQTELEQLNGLIYCAAATVLIENGQALHKMNRLYKPNHQKTPPWERRLNQKIENLRKEIGRLQQLVNGHVTPKILKKLKTQIEQMKTTTEDPQFKSKITDYLDQQKQKLAALSKRLRRYKESKERRQQNYIFKNNERAFYRLLDKEIETNKVPETQRIEKYWSDLWERPREHNQDARWITKETEQYKNITLMEDPTITEYDVKTAITKTNNWRAPGIDGIHNFWYKRFPATHECIVKNFNDILSKPELMPQFMTEGRTQLIPKSDNTDDPSQYRPITCLPTIYKIFTSIITKKIDIHLTRNNIFTDQQKGCRQKTYGCKEQLTIDAVILGQAREHQRNLNIAYIDYQKAFDSVPHSWLLQVLQIYKINNKIIDFLRITKNNWRTTITLKTKKETITTNKIAIKRGIYQGDSLSALWFCLSLNPLSNALNRTSHGFSIKCMPRTLKINHLFYVDDLKMYASTEKQLQSLIDTTQIISTDIHMEFGLQKCKKLTIEKGQIKEKKEKSTDGIETMNPGDTYKYLGIIQNKTIDHTTIKKQLTDTFTDKLKKICKTRLNSVNKTKAINTYAITTLSYSFGIIKWTETDLQNLNRKIRTTLTEYRMHHPRASSERVNITRSKGGRGILDIRAVYSAQIQKMRQYFLNSEFATHRIIRQCDKYTPLRLADNEYDPTRMNITNEQKESQWASKELHGRYKHNLDKENVDVKKSLLWLTSGSLFPETEGAIISIQDQVVNTRNYRKYILKEALQSDTCRKCNNASETIDHIISSCSVLAPTLYIQRHNAVASQIHQELLLKHKIIKEKEPYYRYTPNPVEENEHVKIYWDRNIQTDKQITANKPDITLIDKIQKHTYIIDIAVPADHNITTKQQEKINKYLPLAAEIKKMWKQERVSIIPLIITANGIFPKSFTENLSQLQINDTICYNIQKATLLGTQRIVRSFFLLQ